MIKNYDGIPIFIPNTVVKENKSDNYYISYNPYYRDYGIDTTAIVITIENIRQLFYILKGNHSDKLNECKDLKECIKYYMDNKELIHSYSDEFEHEYILEV